MPVVSDHSLDSSISRPDAKSKENKKRRNHYLNESKEVRDDLKKAAKPFSDMLDTQLWKLLPDAQHDYKSHINKENKTIDELRADINKSSGGLKLRIKTAVKAYQAHFLESRLFNWRFNFIKNTIFY